tara:strand:+ start:3838 stop:4350 length:513 start_codon:yes stop_codon:yes gene_type:complete
MKITRRQLRRIIREAIEEPLGSPMIAQIKKLADVDPIQAFMLAQSFPDFESMDLDFLYPELIYTIASNITDQIPESSYPEMSSSSSGWDIEFEFASLLPNSLVEEYTDIIANEFESIGGTFISETDAGSEEDRAWSYFSFKLGQISVNVGLETHMNRLYIQLKSKGSRLE